MKIFFEVTEHKIGRIRLRQGLPYHLISELTDSEFEKLVPTWAKLNIFQFENQLYFVYSLSMRRKFVILVESNSYFDLQFKKDS